MPAEKVDHRLDLIGKVCPYPTVRTSVTLRDMASGEVLEVITDYYPARHRGLQTILPYALCRLP
jgi:TusA-related sulfurtransferase